MPPSPRPILLDGGTGTELRARGVDVPSHVTSIWSALALMKDPDAVRSVHEDYVRAGADVITTDNSGWADAGAGAIGGCCSIRPADIALLREGLDQPTWEEA